MEHHIYKHLTYQELNNDSWFKTEHEIRKLTDNFLQEKDELIYDYEDVMDDIDYLNELSSRYVKVIYKYEKLVNELIVDNELLPLKHEFIQIIYKRDERLTCILDFTQNNNFKIKNQKRKDITICDELHEIDNNEITKIIYDNMYEDIMNEDGKIIDIINKDEYQIKYTKKRRIKLKEDFAKKYNEMIKQLYVISLKYNKVKDVYKIQKKNINTIKMINAANDEIENLYDVDARKIKDLNNVINYYLKNCFNIA